MYSAVISLIFFAHLSVNSLAAIFAPVLDCDEVFNYWEPTHYLSHGFGLQTWEYSPEYAIRSWLYIALHAAIGQIVKFANDTTGAHLSEFYTTRLALGLICAYCQTCLFTAVSRAVEVRVALLMSMIMLSATGMFYASIAYLPSSFSMYTTMLGTAASLNFKRESRTKKAILWFGIGVIIGWPFSGALIVPLGMDELAEVMLTKDMTASIVRVRRGITLLFPFVVSTAPILFPGGKLTLIAS